MDPTITDDQVEQFERDGALCLRGVFDPHWVETVAAGIAANLAAPRDPAAWLDDTRRFFQDSDNWQRIPEFERFARTSPARLIAARLLRARKINFLHDHVLVKEPGAGKKTIWHQDQPYSPVDGSQFLTMWLPVDPVPLESALEFVAGSHRSGTWYRPQRFLDGTLRPDDDPRWAVLPDIDGHRQDHRILRWAVEPGDCVVFHGLTLHGAPGNTSSTLRRRVLTTRWMGEDTRFALRSGEMSPPPPAAGGPESGAPLDSDAFPVVWRRDDGP